MTQDLPTGVLPPLPLVPLEFGIPNVSTTLSGDPPGFYAALERCTPVLTALYSVSRTVLLLPLVPLLLQSTRELVFHSTYSNFLLTMIMFSPEPFLCAIVLTGNNKPKGIVLLSLSAAPDVFIYLRTQECVLGDRRCGKFRDYSAWNNEYDNNKVERKKYGLESKRIARVNSFFYVAILNSD